MSLVLMGSTSGSVTLQEPAVAGSTVLDLPATSGTVGLTTSQIGMKNRIINGAMVIDQRNNGAVTSSNGAGGGNFAVDRFNAFATGAGRFSYGRNQGSVTPPAGFINYAGYTSTTNNTPASTDVYIVYQWIEGNNVADLGWGTANAKTVTLSFWVRSSLTGTHSGSLINKAQNRGYAFTFQISAANTWEYKTVTIPGDTTGTWVTDNTEGIGVIFNLGSGSSRLGTAGSWQTFTSLYGVTGSVNVLGTNGATFYITGVQLELGSAATTFDFRAYGTELALCQRYTYRHSAEGDIDNFAPLGMGRYYATNNAQLYIPFKVTMRTSPSSVTQVGNIAVNDTGFAAFAITLVLNERSSSGATVTGSTSSGTTAGNATTFYSNNTSNAALIFSAEL